MKRAAVINLSHPHYNLGACKLATWLRSEGWEVEELERDPGLFLIGFDLVCVSAIFSWDVPKGVDLAARKHDYEVWAGGPAFLQMADYWKRETGLTATKGLDQRFERQRGKYRMTFAARGCPVGCFFCGVPELEGKAYTMDWEFQPSPILCDNNITDEPVDFQEHIIKRYQETETKLLDANSGFEPKNFTEETYQRWKGLLRGPWRFGYDYLPERGNAIKMLKILKDEPANKKRVYVMIGNESVADCKQRCDEVIELGGEPYCQPYLLKTATDRHEFVIRHDWTAERLTAFTRYFNRFLWRNLKLWDYRPSVGRRPFAELM